MRRRFLKLFVTLLLVPVLLLSSCAFLQPAASSSPDGTPDASPAATASEAPAPAVTDWHSGVKTDYSGLTPYQPPEELCTRLTEGPMPELKPSADYGKLLPYVGAALYGDSGYLSFNLFGLATERGVIVTDPVFARAFQGSYYDDSEYSSTYVPAYALVRLTEPVKLDDPWNSNRYAACALDGSWITAFDYTSITFTDKVIIAMRSYEKNDVDVLDYSGRLLYNSASLGCFDLLQPQTGYSFLNGYGDGLIAAPLASGKTVYIDALTGAERYTDYGQAEEFSGGMARVTENGLTGFINRDFQLIIKPQFLYADNFSNGKSVVQRQDNSYAVIDTEGAVLYDSPYLISRYDRSTYSVYDSNNTTRYYDKNFNEISSDGNPLTPLSDGWYTYPVDGGAVLLNGREKYTLEGIGAGSVSGVAGGLVYYYVNQPDTWAQGVKTLNGKDILPLTENASVYLVTSTKTGDVFIGVSYYGKTGSDQTFKILDRDGNTVLSGTGYAAYNDQLDLFQVYGEQFFGYADTAGKYVFRVSLLQYMPD